MDNCTYWNTSKSIIETAQIRNQIPESWLIPNPRIFPELHGGIKLPKIKIRKAKKKKDLESYQMVFTDLVFVAYFPVGWN